MKHYGNVTNINGAGNIMTAMYDRDAVGGYGCQ